MYTPNLTLFKKLKNMKSQGFRVKRRRPSQKNSKIKNIFEKDKPTTERKEKFL